MSLVGFQASKIWMFFFGKFTVEQVLKSFSGRNSFLKSSVFGFYDALSYDLEKSKEWRALISWVLISCVILSSRCGFANYFDILNFLFQIYIQEGVLTC